jgi:3-hydroxyacyl-CoA dehydrogenase/enoyl-CoA hydratase/3-hydroxybutyryl-CoA epimerase
VPGFLVNKVLTPYMFAAMKRLEEGEDKEKIDEAVRSFGMPMGPIELADSVGLDVCAHVAKILGQSSEGSRLERLVASGRLGKKTGEGFYVWKDDKPVKSERKFAKVELDELGRQLIDPMIAEAQKSLDEGVVETADLVDAGMIFGTGFAPFRGGPLHYKKSLATPAPIPARRDAAE